MQNAGRKLYSFEDYTLDLTRGSLRNAGGEIELRPKSFELLRYLIENAGRLISKDELVNAVWPDVIVGDDSLAQCVSELRHALNDPDRRIIKTVPRRGYLLAAVASVSSPHSARGERFAGFSDGAGQEYSQEAFALGPERSNQQAQMTATRRLAAIMAADVVGYSRLIGADECGTLQALRAMRAELFDPAIAAHRGRLVKTTGDGLLVEFGSVVDALQCATQLQEHLAEHNEPAH
jgi:DNA-binding winged helix-turn-helix (wHTH) protein